MKKYKISKVWYNISLWGNYLFINVLLASLGITMFSTPLWYILWIVLWWGKVCEELALWASKQEVILEVDNG